MMSEKRAKTWIENKNENEKNKSNICGMQTYSKRSECCGCGCRNIRETKQNNKRMCVCLCLAMHSVSIFDCRDSSNIDDGWTKSNHKRITHSRNRKEKEKTVEAKVITNASHTINSIIFIYFSLSSVFTRTHASQTPYSTSRRSTAVERIFGWNVLISSLPMHSRIHRQQFGIRSTSDKLCTERRSTNMMRNWQNAKNVKVHEHWTDRTYSCSTSRGICHRHRHEHFAIKIEKGREREWEREIGESVEAERNSFPFSIVNILKGEIWLPVIERLAMSKPIRCHFQHTCSVYTLYTRSNTHTIPVNWHRTASMRNKNSVEIKRRSTHIHSHTDTN